MHPWKEVDAGSVPDSLTSPSDPFGLPPPSGEWMKCGLGEVLALIREFSIWPL